MPQPRYRAYLFTMNNYDDGGIDRLKSLDYRYILWGKEVGDSGTPHLQGFIYWKTAKTFSATCQHMMGCHIEIAKNNNKAMQYCKKGEQSHEEWDAEGTEGDNYGYNADIFEAGSPPQEPAAQGEQEKERWKEINRKAMAGDMDWFMEHEPKIFFLQHNHILSLMRRYKPAPPQLTPDQFTGEWYHGGAGSGKSRKAHFENPGAFKKNINKWWCGFQSDNEQHNTIIIEEWNPGVVAGINQYLKIWTDLYAFPAESKGSSEMIRPTKIIITSNYSMDECFGHDVQGLLIPMQRRFNVSRFDPSFPWQPPVSPPFSEEESDSDMEEID